MKNSKIVIILLAAVILMSCPTNIVDENFIFTGNVKWNNLPAEGVKLNLVVDNTIESSCYSDQFGNFNFSILTSYSNKSIQISVESGIYIDMTYHVNITTDKNYTIDLIKDDVDTLSPAYYFGGLRFSADFNWHSYQEADYYRLTYTILDSLDDPVIIDNIRDTSVTINNLLDGETDYVFYLDVFNSNGIEIASTFWPITTPVIGGESKSFTGKILWNSQGVSNFLVSIYSENGAIFYGSRYTDNLGNYNIPLTNLVNGNKYRVQLPKENDPYFYDYYALDYTGSDVNYNFNVVKNDINIITPTGTSATVTTPLYINWDIYQETTHHQISLYNFDTSTVIFTDDTFTGSDYTTPTLEAGTRYQFTIWAYNDTVEIAQKTIYFTAKL